MSNINMISQIVLISLTTLAVGYFAGLIVKLRKDNTNEYHQMVVAHMVSRPLRDYFGFSSLWLGLYNSVCYAAMIGFHMWYALAASLLGSVICIALALNTQHYFRNNDLSILH